MHKFLLLYSWFIYTIMFFFPDIPVLMRLRGFLYGLMMNKSGRNFQVAHDVILKSLEYISVGDDVYIANMSIIIAGRSHITLEDQVMIGPKCVLVDGNHGFYNQSYRFAKGSSAPIILKYGSWVAGNCTVLGGSILPKGSVLGANSLLNKPYKESNSIYGGLPAKHIKQIRQ